MMQMNARLDDVPRGILWMVAATVLFAVSNAIVKWTVATYPPGEVLFLRSLTTFAVVALVLLPRFGLSVYATSIPFAHCARGLSQSISQGLTVLALALLPLATATAISFTTPLWAALIAMFDWRAIDGMLLLVILGMSVTQVFGQWFSMTALRLAPAATVAPAQFTQILWATLFGALFFNEWPHPLIWVGAALIMASGYSLMRSPRSAV